MKSPTCPSSIQKSSSADVVPQAARKVPLRACRFPICVLIAIAATACGSGNSTSTTAPSNTSKIAAVDFEPFYRAALKDDSAEMNRLLSTGLSANARGKHGDPLLYYFAFLGRPTAVGTLLDHGAQINALNSHGESALSSAVLAGQKEVVKLLLERGADPNLGTDSVPLDEVHDAEICRLLIAHHAKLGGAEHAEETPLYWAATGGYPEVVRVLLEAGANVRALDSSGYTPMLKAAEFSQWDCVILMANDGGNVREFDKTDENKTVLHYAALARNLDAIRALVTHGASVDAKDKLGRTPLDYAKFGDWKGNNASEIFRLLTPR